MNRKSGVLQVGGTVSAAIATMLVAGCATSTTRGTATLSSPPPPVPQVYVYPLRGQDPQRQQRDRYECFNWAVSQSGFDPSRQPLPRETRQAIVPVYPAGAIALAGAATGAMIGAAVSDPWDRGEGALVGAVAGTAIGAVAASLQQANPQQISTQDSPRRYDNGSVRREGQYGEFSRAMAACLEGRGYVVK
jgi:outer membrane lipoprotein SlyB